MELKFDGSQSVGLKNIKKMAIPIDNNLFQDVQDYIAQSETLSYKRVKSNLEEEKRQKYLYIQVSTSLNSLDIHYEYYQGRVELHFEGRYADDSFRNFKNHLIASTSGNECLSWKDWQKRKNDRCVLEREINSAEDLCQAFSDMIDIFDSLIKQFTDSPKTSSPSQDAANQVANHVYELQEEQTGQLEVKIRKVGELSFDKLIIPPYQRPYKWTANNVNQLISDLLTFKHQQQYRLGTLVLHNNEIVDGQQRIITLALLIRVMYETLPEGSVKDNYQEQLEGVEAFMTSENVAFTHRYTLHNVVENIHAIQQRQADFDQQLLDFLLNKCEFVVVSLGSISEAFQFFDAQNARGKDLAPHDLLKAYHLREIPSLTEEDSHNIDEWQKQSTDFLKELFLILFRAKRWSHGKTAKYFTKDHTEMFKGISLIDGKRYPFYQMEVIVHLFTTMYNQDPVRMIDQQRIEYPFNLDDQIVNGGRFFDMIRHYADLYQRIRNYRDILPDGSRAKEIMKMVKTYKGCQRTGDRYVRSMFYTLLLYYVDRFGEEELDRVVPQFFIWAYKLRLELSAVRLASVDNYAAQWGSMFRHIHEAQTPYDLINVYIEGVKEIKCSGCEEVKEIFTQYKKYYG